MDFYFKSNKIRGFIFSILLEIEYNQKWNYNNEIKLNIYAYINEYKLLYSVYSNFKELSKDLLIKLNEYIKK